MCVYMYIYNKQRSVLVGLPGRPAAPPASCPLPPPTPPAACALRIRNQSESLSIYLSIHVYLSISIYLSIFIYIYVCI